MTRFEKPTILAERAILIIYNLVIADIVHIPFKLFSQCPLALSLGQLFYSITTQYIRWPSDKAKGHS